LGQNPNGSVEDEYISNLQQQIHFMELELKILKEKVVEDEKKSGIGSLFDDEKSSFQHISLLKQKYQKMRRDYDRKLDELNKYKLNVIGEQFVLDSQINIMLAQNQKIEDQQKDYNSVISKRHFDLDKELKDVSKQRLDVESDLRGLDSENFRESNDNYDNKMTMDKEKHFEELGEKRHLKEKTLNDALIADKEKERDGLKIKLLEVEAKFLANADLQKSLADGADLRNMIEIALIKLDLLQIQVKEFEDVTEYLNAKKDELLEAKKLGEIKNEELKKELAAKEEIAAKRLQVKINRDKNVEVKELLAQEETAVQHNHELVAKLEEEKKKYEGLLDETLEVKERLIIATKAFEETKIHVKEQEEVIAKLREKIEAQQKVTEELALKVEDEKKVNRIEDERFRKLAQMNAALKAKLDFIQSKYDFTTNVSVLNSDDFKSLMTSNEMVSYTLVDVSVDKYYNWRPYGEGQRG
jgi:hypothetical protein